MAYEQRENSGTAFRNDKKKETHPDWRGELLVKEGGKYRVSIWEKQGKKGPFLSINLEPNTEEKPKPAAQSQEPDDYPF